MKPSFYKFLFWAWFGLVFLSSFFSTGWITKINDPNNNIRSDYFLHFIVFFAFPLVGWYATKTSNSNKGFFLLMIAPLGLAFIAEFVQKYVANRVFNLNDLVANVLGIVVGSLLIWLIKSTRDNLSNQ